MTHSWACVTSGYDVLRPGASRVWFLITHHFGDMGSKGGPVKVKFSVQLTICGHGGVQTGGVEEVKCNERLGD